MDGLMKAYWIALYKKINSQKNINSLGNKKKDYNKKRKNA